MGSDHNPLTLRRMNEVGEPPRAMRGAACCCSGSDLSLLGRWIQAPHGHVLLLKFDLQ